MLREKILRKIYFTTLIVFVLFVTSTFTINRNISNIKTEYETKLTSIYLLDNNNYLLKVNISIKDNLMDNIPIVINNLKEGNKHYSGLRGIIPHNTKINSFSLIDGIINVDFSKEFLNINSDLLEKEIESIVYSLIDFNEIKGVKILVNKKPLKDLIKSDIIVDDILNENFGINKEYSINSINNIQKVVLYYYEEKDNNKYYVPVTKYINSKDDKIKIIIDNLKSNYLVKTNLMSYINEKIAIKSYENLNNTVTISFDNVMDLSLTEPMEEVIYTISSSIMDSNIATKVIFMQNDRILAIKQK